MKSYLFLQKAYSTFVIHEFQNKRKQKKKKKNGASNLLESKSFCSDFTSSDFMIIQPQLGLSLPLHC